MLLTSRQLNRTLLDRQGLLERAAATTYDTCHRLVGLQAQDRLPPYLGLAARLDAFDPDSITRGLEDRSLVRVVSLRGTLHLHTAEDALSIRRWTAPVQARELTVAGSLAPVRDLDVDEFGRVVRECLADGPLPSKRLGETLAARFPGRPATPLVGLARVTQPLAQLPPRGTWRRTGGVVYQYVDRWVGRPLAEPDPADLVRRYLRSFGPATAADITTWSGVPGSGALLDAMPDLVEHRDENGRRLVDVAEGVITEPDRPAPPRLLGVYDNLWLSHSGRDRVTPPDLRRRWAGANGGQAATVFVDGTLAGLWRVVAGRVGDVQLFGPLSRSQRTALDEEIGRVDELLAR